jgi:DNA-binding NarL/FixJ family response regulator
MHPDPLLPVLGRERELRQIVDFLSDERPLPAALAVVGEPGVGKSTVIRASLATSGSAETRLLAASPSADEHELPYLALQDLLRDVPDIALEALAAPQQDALRAALLRSSPSQPAIDPRTIGTAVLTLVRGFLESEPVVVAIDDVQWMDPASAAALGFAIRRLDRGRLRLIVGQRDASSGPFDLRHLALPVQRVELGPLGAEVLDAILHAQLGRRFSKPELTRIAAWSQGNPLFALEVARALTSQRSPLELEADAPPPVPGLETLIGTRLRGQPPGALLTLQIVSLAGRINERRLESVTARLHRPVELPVASEALITRGPTRELRLSHPLLASGAVATMIPSLRRRVHAALAVDEPDPVARARHLFHATVGADPAVAEALASASRVADASGAWDAAVELMELACRATPPRDAATIQARQLVLGRLAARLGDAVRARAALDAASGGPDSGAAARALVTLQSMDSTRSAAWQREIERRARARAIGDPALLAEIALGLAGTPSERYRHARAAERIARRCGLEGLEAQAVARQAAVAFQLGLPFDPAVLDRAVELEAMEPGGSILDSAAYLRAWVRFFEDDHARSRQEFEALLDRAVRIGDEASSSGLLRELAHLAIRAGRWPDADRLARVAIVAAERSEQAVELAMSHLLIGAVASLRGEREVAEESLGLATDLGDRADAGFVGGLAAGRLGTMYLSLGLWGLALAAFTDSRERLALTGWRDPALTNWRGDLAELNLLLGRPDEAEALVEQLAASIRGLRRPVSAAIVERGRALLAGSRGALADASTHAEASVTQLRALQDPFELARSLRAAGAIARRTGRKSVAAGALEESTRLFGSLGARAWEALVRRELGRVGLRPRAPRHLTETEVLVTRLAAEGLTNRQVAERAFVSPRTVESILARAYVKLGISSRAELGRAVGRRETDEAPAPKGH